MRSRRLSLITVLAVMVFSFSNLVWAHHSTAGFDNEKEVVQHGVVKEYNWKNPHVFVVWEVKDASGKVVEWTGQMNSPTSMIQVGMNRNSLKPGDEIVISINPSKTPYPLGIIRKITTADGRLVVDRFPAK